MRTSGKSARKKKGFKRRRSVFSRIFGGFSAPKLTLAPVSGSSASGRQAPEPDRSQEAGRASLFRKFFGKRTAERPARSGTRASWGGGYLDFLRLVAVAGLVLVAVLVAFDGWANADEVYGGVEVGGVGVGGASQERAQETLAKSAGQIPERITFVPSGPEGVGDRESVTLSAEELGIRIDAEESARAAYAVGREEEFGERLEGRLRSAFRVSEVGAEITYREAALRDAFEVRPVEAGYTPTGDPDTLVSITPGRDGVAIEESFWKDLDRKIMSGAREIEVPLKSVAPKLTTAEAERLKPTGMLSSFSTNYLTYDDTPGRVANLQISSDAVNGTFLAPGEVFSFNELAEPLDYEASKVIVQGRVDEADGGGLCQVSSTLYVAANLAGLEIVERHPHMAELPYIQPGLDATVWFGALDMKFKNTTDGYLYIQQWVDTTTGDVSAAIYGIPNGVTGTMDSERIAKYKDANKNTVTEWVTYRTVTRDGEVVESGPVHTDVYTSLEED